MTELEKQKLGKILWTIADQLRGAMNADDFRDYMLAFLFLRYLSDNYEAAAQKGLGRDYPKSTDGATTTPLQLWYKNNLEDVREFEKQMRRKVHYVIKPKYLWGNIVEMARTQDAELLDTLQEGFSYIETNPSPAPSAGCSRRSTWYLKSSEKSTRTAMPAYAKSSAKLPMGWRSFPPTATPWAMLMNT